MTRWGRVDFSDLYALRDNLDRLERFTRTTFIEDTAKELAARLLAKVIRKTPTGVYEDGRVGGTLKRGWTVKTEQEATSGVKVQVKAYVDSLIVSKVGNDYTIELINPVHYAPYVEFGHRTRGGNGWVDGRFMLTISEKELEAQAPKIIERKIMKYLQEAFNV